MEEKESAFSHCVNAGRKGRGAAMTSSAGHFQIRGSIVVSISACHAEDPGSIPGRGVHCNSSGAKPSQLLAQPLAMRSPRVVCEAMPKTCKQEGRMRKKPAHPPSGARSGPQTRQRARAPIALAHMEESSHTGRRRNREERAAPGIEPGTSRTLSENHATRPNSRCSPRSRARQAGLLVLWTADIRAIYCRRTLHHDPA